MARLVTAIQPNKKKNKPTPWKGEVLHLCKIELAHCSWATEPPKQENKLVYTGIVHGLKAQQLQQSTNGCNLIFIAASELET